MPELPILVAASGKQLLGVGVSFAPQDDMRSLLRRYEFNALVSHRPQVNSSKQRLSPAEQDWRDSDVQFINEGFTKILPNCVRPPANPHVFSNSGLACAVERLANATGYEV